MKNKSITSFLVLIFLIGMSSQAQTYLNNFSHAINPRARIIMDNDFGGDPDGLFQMAHHLLSPTIEVKAIICSITYPDGFYGYPGNPQYSSQMASELLKVMNLDRAYNVLEGAGEKLKDIKTPIETVAAKAIIEEAMRDDEKPLYMVCGAGLTNIASAWLMEPKIADRLTLIWIGGMEYEGLAWPPPGGSYNWEYNTGIDPIAAQVIFNQSDIPIWQVPRNAYRQALYSYAELTYRVKDKGETGAYLMDRLDDLLKRSNNTLGEAYVLGDSPLVLLTALQSSWEVDPSSSKYAMRTTPHVTKEGGFEENPEGRNIRVYDQLDVRLMFEDFVSKLVLFNNSNSSK
ncbi:nucleoside hydrolase [Marinoscillum sp. MHG1-6]|uniref:nucleoside hydrolase n=1 Tax=Marinoscillum sp. MHG1-6 TaxID=2959627 RepID=UPI002157A76E|nr:nucleoside hydrolase [Marinoscillum sp. MHG1-6]